MAVPTLTTLTPSAGPASGGDLVRLMGTDFASQIAVTFDGLPASVIALRDEAGTSIADVRTPAHQAALVAVELQNLAFVRSTMIILPPYRCGKDYHAIGNRMQTRRTHDRLCRGFDPSPPCTAFLMR